jgi:hypothetical protein
VAIFVLYLLCDSLAFAIFFDSSIVDRVLEDEHVTEER